MNEQLRMFTLAANTMFDSPQSEESDRELISYLTASCILLLRGSCDEDGNELAHMLYESAMRGPRLDEQGRSLVRSTMLEEFDE